MRSDHDSKYSFGNENIYSDEQIQENDEDAYHSESSKKVLFKTEKVKKHIEVDPPQPKEAR